MKFSQFLGIGNRFKPQKPFPDRNLTQSGGIESTFTKITNLERRIRKVETITNQNQHINKNSFLDSPEIKDIIGIWYNHNFRANDEIKLKLENEYNEVNKAGVKKSEDKSYAPMKAKTGVSPAEAYAKLTEAALKEDKEITVTGATEISTTFKTLYEQAKAMKK